MNQITNNYNTLVRSIEDHIKTIRSCGLGYEPLLKNIRTVIEKFTNYLFHYNQQKADLLKQKESMDTFMNKAKSALKLREEKIKKLKESITIYENAAKNVLTSMRFYGLGKVKKEPNVERLYQFLYVNLYHESPDTFDFDKLCKVAFSNDVIDFQKRLAKFSIYDLELESREKIFEMKNADYSLNKNNDELNYLLEWLDYNFEAYVLLKEKTSEENIIHETLKKEGIKDVQIEASDNMLDEINSLIVYLEDSIQYLRVCERRLSDALNENLRNPRFKEINQKTESLIKMVEEFPGNKIVNEINGRFSSG